MPPEPKTTEEKLRELDRNIARQETAIAPLTPAISPARPERSVIGPMERLGRKILAVAITIWFALMAALIILQQGIDDPMGLAGILAFGGFVCFENVGCFQNGGSRRNDRQLLGSPPARLISFTPSSSTVRYGLVIAFNGSDGSANRSR